jgi:predicted enzyme related to lactoylglutathione lyase
MTTFREGVLMSASRLDVTKVGINAGIVKPKREGLWPGNRVLYIDVDDLAAYRKKVIASGEKIHVEEQPVPGMGAFCLSPTPRDA